MSIECGLHPNNIGNRSNDIEKMKESA
jgi:hypothetical protein